MKIIHGDCLDELKALDDNSIDSIVTDPPYGLSFMGKKWDYDVPSVEVWRECLRVLKPGGHLLSFGGTRTYHRLAVNIEDAGFEIRDQIQWLYGSGFPKSHNISKAIDKKMGAEREIIKTIKKTPSAHSDNMHEGYKRPWAKDAPKKMDITAPATTQAKQWDGWGTALKPANEPICLARKPFKGTVVDNVLKWGTGGINVDGCRVRYQSEKDKRLETRGVHVGGAYQHKAGNAFKKEINKVAEVNHQGRFPANVILDEQAGAMLDEQSGPCKIGGASRFYYCAKSSKSERGLENNHPTIKPIKLMAYLCRLITPPKGIVLDPFMGSGSTGIAAIKEGFEFIGIEKETEYVEIATKRIENENK